MAYGFNPATAFLPQEDPLKYLLTPEELQQQEIAARFDANRSKGFAPAMLSALDYVRTAMPAQAPAPRTVSGGSVIGLMPEQTNALLNRVNEANMLDQRMFEARQAEMRDDARTREGRILTAREAQARRQQELAIERQKLDMEARKEAAERARPKLTPLAGNPGYLLEERIGPDGNPVATVVKAGGLAVPEKEAAPKMGWVVENGQKVWRQLSEGTTQGEMPLSADEEFKIVKETAKMFENWGRKGEDGKIVPITPQEAIELARKEFNQEPYDTGELFPLDKPKYMQVTNEDGSVTWKEVGPGDQIKPPKSGKDKDPFDYLKKTFGTNWAKGDKQTMANALGQAGFTIEQIRQAIGPEVAEDGGWFWFDKQNYKPPTVTPTASGGKVVVERRKNPTTGKIMVKYNDGSTGYE